MVVAMAVAFIGEVHPVVAGERKAELLELPDGCNALFVNDAHGLFRR
jgi:hypothetical protein